MTPTIERYGSGHINETYLMTCPDGPKYIFQKINTAIFPDPDKLMENIVRVTEHIRARHPNDPRCTLTVLDYSSPWRQYAFIDHARTYDLIERPDQAFKVAQAFAKFQNDLADLPGPRLHDIIPHFHDTRARLAQLDAAVAADVKGRRKDVSAELAFVDAHRAEAGRILDLMASGAIPERITHNDTKINNVMLDDATGEGVAVIDLDTVMPGCALYDFGDMVRTSTAAAAEDARDLATVYSRKDYFEQLVRGYLSEAKFLNAAERDNLAFSGRLITFTIGVRFLTDYLAGDVYFHTTCPDHNLVRCRTQFKMVQSMEEQAADYEAIVRQVAAENACGR